MIFTRIRVLPYGPRLEHLARVGVVGAIGLIVQTSIFELLGIQFEILRPSTAALIGGEIAVLLGFTLNNRYNFTEHTASTHVRLIKFHTVVAGSLFLQWLFVRLAEHYFGDSTLLIRLAYASGVALGFLSNYIGYTLWVWKKH